MGYKVKLASGTIVALVAAFGAQQEMEAARLADVPANLTQEGLLLVNWASIAVATEAVQKPGEAPKTLEDLTGTDPSGPAMIMAFRERFTQGEWSALTKAVNQLFPNPTEAERKAFKMTGPRTARLSTGKVVEFVEEWGPREQLRAVQVAAVPASPSRAEWLQLVWVTTMVGIKSVTPAGGDPVLAESVITTGGEKAAVTFRDMFTNIEWGQVEEAYNLCFPTPAGEEFTIQS